MYASFNRSVLAALAALVALGASSAFAQGPNAVLPRSVASSASGAVDVQTMDLQLGEQRVIPSDNVRSYSEANKGIVDVRLTKDASQFVIVALKPGSTTLLFIMMDGAERHYRITVTDPNARGRQNGDSGTVEARDNIRLDFYFVQVSKNYTHKIGIGWPGSIAPGFNATYNVQAGTLDSATAVISNQALPRLDMAQATGWAKVMRQAAVVTANGEKATFSGGGELNFAVQSALASSIQKIPYGSIIDVEPRYDAKTGRIELRLHADVSELEADTGTGIPGRITANLDTQVNLELGQSLILAGLTARSERRAKTGLPVLSQIPILGVFFGSHARTESESENIVIIVPSVVDAVSMQDRERVNAALRSYTDFSGDMGEVDYLPPPKTSSKPVVAGPAPRAP
jgi:pilus assembly protein CpaC